MPTTRRVRLGARDDVRTYRPSTFSSDHGEVSDDDERLAAGAALIAGLAHELRNALAAADSALYLAQRAADDGPRRAHHDAARAQVHVAQDLVSRALDATRGEPLRADDVALADVIERATGAARDDPAIHLEVDVAPPDLAVHGDVLLLARAVENLVDNARQVARGAGRERVRVWVHARAAAPFVVVRVEDDGPGIDAAVRERMFEPLATARPGGTGLGLAFVQAVAALHGGAAEGEDREGGGAVFILRLRPATVSWGAR